MIFHASIPADEPERVARVIAELWRCEYFPFVIPGTYVVIADDERGSEIEVSPRGMEGVPGESEVDFQMNASPSAYNEVHLNLATRLSREEIEQIGRREGWTARICDRGGQFRVIEFWLENKFMLELMTPEELERYRSAMAPGVWRARNGKEQT